MSRFSKGLTFRLLCLGCLLWVGAFAVGPPAIGNDKGVITKTANGIKKGAEAVVEGAKVVNEDSADGAEIVAEETAEGAEVVARGTVGGALAVGKGGKTVVKRVEAIGRKIGRR